MSGPSKEALGRVFSLGIFNENEMDLLERVATAFQELMDERDAAKAATTEVGNAAADLQRRMDQHALDAVKNQRDDSRAAYNLLSNKIAEVLVRAETAEAKLAECVRRVREWTELWNDGATTVSGLCAILADYAPKTEEPGR